MTNPNLLKILVISTFALMRCAESASPQLPRSLKPDLILTVPKIDSSSEKLDDTKQTFGSTCSYVDGIRADGAKGTPMMPPYNGGSWFSSIEQASKAFGRTLAQISATHPTQCVTVCPQGEYWNGAACSASCGAPPAQFIAKCSPYSEEVGKTYIITKTTKANCTIAITDSSASACASGVTH